MNLEGRQPTQEFQQPEHRILQALKRFLAYLYAHLPRIYLAVALVSGAAFVVLTPPNAAPDEISHLTKATRVAHGNLFGAPAMDMPNIPAWYGPFQDSRMLQAPPFAFRLSEVRQVAAAPLQCERAPRAVNDGVASYSPLLYLVPASTYLAACALEASFGSYLYITRALNLLLAITLTAWGIRAARDAGWALMAVALLPTVLYQMASVSADASLLALSFVFIGHAVALMRGEGSAGTARVVLVSAWLLAFSKPGYVWLAWLGLLAYPQLRSLGWTKTGIAVAFGLVPVVLQVILLYLSIGATPPVAGIHPGENLNHLLTHPWHFFSALAAIFHANPFGTQWNLYESLVGKLGWLNVPLGSTAYVLYALLLAGSLAMLARRPLAPTQRIGTMSLCLLSVCLVALPLYLFATGTGAESIFGLQGRYFIPSLLLGVVALSFSGHLLLRTLLAPVMIAGPCLLLAWAALCVHTVYFRDLPANTPQSSAPRSS